MKISKYMTQKLVTATPEMSVKAAFLTMRAHRVRHLPVVVGDRLEGIISDRDLRRPRWADNLDDWTTYYQIDDNVSVQAPPNLNPASAALLIRAGINDFGGISPLTPDYINPGHPWPHLSRLSQTCSDAGYQLAARLPVYDRYLEGDTFLDPSLRSAVDSATTRIAQITDPSQLAVA